MRSRLALLLAAAVIFAPGWHGNGRAQDPRGNDLAARVLAPTVDDGAIREAAADMRDPFGGRQTKRWRSGITLEAAASFGVGVLAFAILWLVASYSRALIGLYQLRFCFSRAPPRLQPA